MSVEVCNYNFRLAFSAHRVMKTRDGSKKILAPLNKSLRELVVRKLFAQLEEKDDSLMLFEDISTISKGSESSMVAHSEEACADPNPSEGAIFV